MEQLLLPVMFFAVGLVLVFVSWPLRQRKIAPNNWYGVRVRATLEDESIWYDVNAQAGQELFSLGVSVMVVSSLFWGLGASLPVFVFCCSLLLVGGALRAVFRSVRLADELWKQRHP